MTTGRSPNAQQKAALPVAAHPAAEATVAVTAAAAAVEVQRRRRRPQLCSEAAPLPKQMISEVKITGISEIGGPHTPGNPAAPEGWLLESLKLYQLVQLQGGGRMRTGTWNEERGWAGAMIER